MTKPHREDETERPRKLWQTLIKMVFTRNNDKAAPSTRGDKTERQGMLWHTVMKMVFARNNEKTAPPTRGDETILFMRLDNPHTSDMHALISKPIQNIPRKTSVPPSARAIIAVLHCIETPQLRSIQNTTSKMRTHCSWENKARRWQGNDSWYWGKTDKNLLN